MAYTDETVYKLREISDIYTQLAIYKRDLQEDIKEIKSLAAEEGIDCGTYSENNNNSEQGPDYLLKLIREVTHEYSTTKDELKKELATLNLLQKELENSNSPLESKVKALQRELKEVLKKVTRRTPVNK